MNTVALPASSARGALGHETTIARSAVRGDDEAFAELFRRHGQCAWRLAQAVAVGREAASGAVCEGFTSTLKDLRRHHKQDAGDLAFRVTLLSSVYRAAVQELHDRPQLAQPVATRTQPAKSRAKGKNADSALLESAFRSLPERWRAALWLSEVETMSVESVGSSLGVSAAVAAQLLTRAERGLAGRFAQARRPVPEHLGPALRPMTAALPASLSDDALEHWRAVAGLPVARLAPVGAWLSEHSERPLQVASAVLLAMGLVGLGVVGNASHTKAGPTAVSTPPNSAGSVTVGNQATSSPVPIISPSVPFSSLGQNGALGAAATAAASTAATGSGGSGSTGGVRTNTGSNGSPASTTSPSGRSTSPGSTPHTNPSAPASNPGSTLNLGVATVNLDSGGLSVTVLPSSTGSTSAASATVGSRSGCATGLSLTVGTTTIGCSLTNPISTGTSGSSTTNAAPSSSLSSALSSTVSSATQTVTSTLGNTVSAVSSALGNL